MTQLQPVVGGEEEGDTWRVMGAGVTQRWGRIQGHISTTLGGQSTRTTMPRSSAASGFSVFHTARYALSFVLSLLNLFLSPPVYFSVPLSLSPPHFHLPPSLKGSW